MLRIGLFALLSFCVVLVVWFGFFKKTGVEKRLDAIRSLSDAPEPETAAPVSRPRKSFRFLRIPETVKTSILSAGIPLRVEEFVMIWIAVSFLPALIAFIISGKLLLSAVLIAVCASLPPLYVNIHRKKRRETFNNQLGDALMLLSNGLRAGFSFEQVLESVSRELPPPISQEFGRVVRELKMGVSMESCLLSMTERMESTDLRLLTSAVLIQRQVGGNLADILDTISGTIQDRIRIKNGIKTMTAQGRISGYVIGALPVLIFIGVSVINPEYMQMFYETTLGHILLGVSVGMEILGFAIIRKIINIET